MKVFYKTQIKPFKRPDEESNRSMNSVFLQKWDSLPARERTLTLLILILMWGGIASAVLLAALGVINDPGTFFWGCLFGSVLLAYLAYTKKKKDIVALLTPVYAVIIFMGLEITPNLALQTVFAASLTVLIWRLHMRFS
jgi:uncharacterized membrane protein YjjP (DUF1212 family)